MFSFSLTMLHKLPKNQHPHIPNQNYNRSLVDIHFSWTAVLFMTFHSQLSLLHWMRQRSNCFWQGLSHGVTFSLLMVSSSMWTASRASNNLKKVCLTQDCSVSLPRIFHHGQLCKGLMTQKPKTLKSTVALTCVLIWSGSCIQTLTFIKSRQIIILFFTDLYVHISALYWAFDNHSTLRRAHMVFVFCGSDLI